jgi:signal transduction histidine kinase
LTNLGLDMLAIVTGENQVIWAQVIIDGEDASPADLGILESEHPSSARLTTHHDPLSQTTGFIETGLGPMIVSSRPIVRSDYSGEISGAVIMGQFLNDSRLLRLQDRTGVEMHWDFISATISMTNRNDNSNADADVNIYPDTISSQRVLDDIHGSPFLILQTDTPRAISVLGAKTINVAMTFLVIAGLLVIGVIWFMLRSMILRPIEQLTHHIDEIRQSGDLSHQLDMQRGDEIGVLAGQFDGMTAELHDARRSLLDQSFKAGKSDTAAEVLHNIRNAMTPMVNGLERLRRAFKVTDNLRIADATEQIASPDCPIERKQKFLDYINESFKHVGSVGYSAANDLKIITSQARHVEGILSDQEKFANVAPVAENLDIDEVLDEAVNVIPKQTESNVSVTMDEQLARVRVRAHRIGLLQVMGNLILNAYESIQRSGISAGQISLVAADEIFNDQPMVRVIVRDNGTGFEEEEREHIFQRGFTSKVEGDTNGLGLHWCANAVAGMGGRIIAESAGPGRGAEFHVLLPAATGGSV